MSVEPLLVETASALVVGGEILSGKIRDKNSGTLALSLRALGISLKKIVVVPDEVETIATEIERLIQMSDIVFTSGGVGPTHDDVTVEGVARALSKRVVQDERFVAFLSGHYGANMTDSHRLMARVPEGARLLFSEDARWPTVTVERVWILPGVPELFQAKMLSVRAHLRGPHPFYSRSVFSRDEEANIKPTIDRVVEAHPQVEVGSYPKWFDPNYRTEITLDARQEALVDAAEIDLRTWLGPSVLTRTER